MQFRFVASQQTQIARPLLGKLQSELLFSRSVWMHAVNNVIGIASTSRPLQYYGGEILAIWCHLFRYKQENYGIIFL